MNDSDPAFMRLALDEARNAAAAGEVPVGAVAVRDGRVLATARNRVEERHSAVSHAEIELLHAVEAVTGDWRMDEITFYITKEPCPMCAGALVNARAGRIVFGLADPRMGGCGSALDITGHPGVLWHPEVEGGVLAEEAQRIIREFFRNSREAKKIRPGDIRRQNFQSAAYIEKFNPLMLEAFGMTFDHWFKLHVWDRRYESFAIFDGARMLSHAGLSALTLLIGGRPLPAIQLNGVATTASHRGRGLSRRIMGRILEEHAGTPAFLFANDSVLEFYPRFGFRRAEDFLPVAEERLLPCPAARRITPDEARPLLEKRCQFSRVFDAADGLPIHLFHLYGECRDHIWQLSGETAAVAIQEGSTLRLLDVFGSRPTEWSEVRTRLPFSGIERIEFGFTPDFLKVDFHWERRPESRNLFLRGDFGLPEQFCFPALLET